MALIPVTILTGFLGSGKTTLLKHILTEQHGKKIAVIENEFGEENIDNDILVQDNQENIVQMSNGCICCTIRGDLVDALNELWEQRKDKKISFERVVIETTGVANPGPVAQTFFMDDDVADHYVLDVDVLSATEKEMMKKSKNIITFFYSKIVRWQLSILSRWGLIRSPPSLSLI